MAYVNISNDDLSWQNFIVYNPNSKEYKKGTFYKSNGSASTSNNAGTHSIGYESSRMRVERCTVTIPSTGASKLRLKCRFTRSGGTSGVSKLIYAGISTSSTAYLKWGSLSSGPSVTLSHTSYDSTKYFEWEFTDQALRPGATYYIFFVPAANTQYCYYSFVQSIGQIATDGSAYQLKVKYWSNYATHSFTDALNTVSGSSNVLVREANFYSGKSYPYGLHNFSTSSSGTYLGRTGYSTNGNWRTSTSSTGGYACHEDYGGTGSQIASQLGKTLSSDMTVNVYPQWNPLVYTISLDKRSGSDGTSTVYLKYNTNWYSNSSASKTISSITKPTRTGYTFNGYYTATSGGTQIIDKNGSFVSGKTTFPTSNTTSITLYAQWTLNSYTLTINPNGGTYKSSSGSSLTSNTTYSFTGTHSYVPFSTSSTSAGYTSPSSDTGIRSGYYISQPTKTGYSFDGWKRSDTSAVVTTGYTFGSGSSAKFMYAISNPQKSFTVTAQWGLVTYDISYTLNGGSASGLKYSYNVTTASFTLPIATKTGYYFKGWTGSNGTTASRSVTISKGSTGDKSYTANFAAKKLTVRFNKNDGSGLQRTQTFTYGANGNQFGYNNSGSQIWPATSGSYADSYGFGSWAREGYKIIGWGTTSSTTTVSKDTYYDVEDSWINSQVGDAETKTIDLYAIWAYNGTVRIYDTSSDKWKMAIPYIYTSSGWKMALPYVNKNGTSAGWTMCGG